MRWLPHSMAQRTTLALGGGLALIMALATVISSLVFLDDTRAHRSTHLVERAHTIAAIISAARHEVRQDILDGVADLGFDGTWIDDPKTTPIVSPDLWSMWHQQRLASALRELGAGPVLIGHESDARRNNKSVSMVGHGPLYVWVKLPDSTWLRLRANSEWYDPALFVEPALVLLVLGLGVVALAIWVARRVTAPLGRFATAASQLGANIDAPPLTESGPTEIAQAARAFNTMRRRIRRYVEDRLHMLTAISHDLRTPITRLRLRAEFVADDEQRAKMLGDLDEMETMIAETISFARMETLREPSETVDISGLLHEIGADFASDAVTIGEAAPAVMLCRRVAIKRALTNLIANAIAYGGHAAIRLDAELDAGSGQIFVTIEDDGPGLPESELEAVFTPFYRVDRSRSRESGGTGLGLAVARTVVRGLGGDITLSNRPEGGLRQIVSLPRLGPPEEPTASAERKSRDDKQVPGGPS